MILTPHIGGSTAEAQANIGLEVAEKLVKYSDNGTSVSSVNFPEVALPAHPGKHRLLHIHQNIPGVMMEINKVFAENGINISGQFLQTNEKVGYVVIDVDAEYSDLAQEKLQHINGTIRSRVLFERFNQLHKKNGRPAGPPIFLSEHILLDVNRDHFRRYSGFELAMHVVASYQLQGCACLESGSVRFRFAPCRSESKLQWPEWLRRL